MNYMDSLELLQAVANEFDVIGSKIEFDAESRYISVYTQSGNHRKFYLNITMDEAPAKIGFICDLIYKGSVIASNLITYDIYSKEIDDMKTFDTSYEIVVKHSQCKKYIAELLSWTDVAVWNALNPE